MGYSVAGKHVLVTGASSGIGAALAEGFARAGATVGICARREDRLREVLERVQSHAADSRSGRSTSRTSTRSNRSRAASERGARRHRCAREQRGDPEAAHGHRARSRDRRVRDGNQLLLPIRLILALLPELMERGGRIVNISSVAARLGPPAEAAYTTSKAALTGWSESMQVDLGIAGSDVRVHVVNPGVIDTDLFHLPDNEESMANIEALPVEAMIEPVLAQLESSTFEIYVPEWFADVVAQKFPDTGSFLAGSIVRARDQLGVND